MEFRNCSSNEDNVKLYSNLKSKSIYIYIYIYIYMYIDILAAGRICAKCVPFVNRLRG